MSEASYSKKDFDAVLVEDSSEDEIEWKPGQFFVLRDSDGVVRSMGICLPNRTDRSCSFGAMNVCIEGQPKPPSPSWIWNGSLDKPTLSPSIHKEHHWHGHLTDGKFVSCK